MFLWRKIDITCRQSRKEDGWETRKGYKLLHLGVGESRNRVRIVVDRDLKNKIVNDRRIEDKILSIEVALEKEMVHIIIVYA